MPDFSCSPFPTVGPNDLELAIEAAKKVFRANGAVQLHGDVLAAAISARIDDQYAADQAVRKLIVDGRLQWIPKRTGGPSIYDENNNPVGISTPSESILPDSGTVPLNLVVVRAAESLWRSDSVLPPSATGTAAGLVSHSSDFRSAHWFGTQYSFTPNQAACVKVLWKAWESGACDVGGETLLEAADASTNRVDVVFRNSLAWGTMIVRGRTKGSYRLIEPAANSP